MLMLFRSFALVTAIVLLPGCGSAIQLSRPLNPGQMAELRLTTASGHRIDVWRIEGRHSGITNTDYVSLGSSLWVTPGRYRMTYACPGATRSNDTVATLTIHRAGVHHLECNREGEIVAKRP